MVANNRNGLLPLYTGGAIGVPRHNARDLSKKMLEVFLGAFGLDEMEVSSAGDAAYAAIKPSCSSLVRKGLIQDPLVCGLGAAFVAVLSFLPLHVYVRTGPGELRILRIKTLLVELDRVARKGQRDLLVQFRLWRLLRIFKDKFIEALEEATRNDDGWPPERPRRPEDIAPQGDEPDSDTSRPTKEYDLPRRPTKPKS
jgi:hypothetical protein